MSWFFREVGSKNVLIPTVCHIILINRPVIESNTISYFATVSFEINSLSEIFYIDL